MSQIFTQPSDFHIHTNFYFHVDIVEKSLNMTMTGNVELRKLEKTSPSRE